MLYDRLSHQSGLDGTVTTPQTTNLPTAALTRYTSGDGVVAALTVYTGASGPGVSFTASYTNQAGTAGRTAEGHTLGSIGAGAFFPMGLQAGDTGVRSVESVTFGSAHGSAGNFGVTLLRPIAILWPELEGVYGASEDTLLALNKAPVVESDAALGMAWWIAGGGNNMSASLSLIFADS